MMRNAVNGYVSTIKAKVNVKQKVIMIKTFSRRVHICFLLTFFKNLWNDYLMRVRTCR